MPILYHYTSIEVFFSMLQKYIIRNQETHVNYLQFWATHILCLNDPSEMAIYRQPFEEQMQNASSPYNSQSTIEDIAAFYRMCSNYYIISLSELQDDINMWRCYGGDGLGVAIGFDFEKVEPINQSYENNRFIMEQVYMPTKCEYVSPSDLIIDSSVIEDVNKSMCSGDTLSQVASILEFHRKYINRKHNAYAAEKEWRLIVHNGNPPLFNLKNGKIINRYVLHDIPISAITNIIMGPRLQKDTSTAKQLVDLIHLKLHDCVNIEYSDIPYR